MFALNSWPHFGRKFGRFSGQHIPPAALRDRGGTSMLQVCANLRIHPYRYHGGDSGTTRKGPCAPRRRIVLRQRLPAAAAAVPGKQGRVRSGEEAVHGAEQGRPPRVEREVVHV